MKQQLWKISITGVLSLSLAGFAVAQRRRDLRPPSPPAPAGVYTNASGTIAQFNYNRDAMVEGFLLSDKTLVHLPPNAAPVIGPALRASDTVEVAGLANTNPSGVRTIEAQQVKDRTTGKTFAVPQPGPAAPYSGSGRIQQLNYGPDGSVNGFLLDNGTLAELPPFSATNPSSIRTGSAVTFTGYARGTITGRTVVDLQSISINGQTLTLAGREAAAGPVAPAGPGRPPAPSAPPAERNTEEPPPPPAPPAAPQP